MPPEQIKFTTFGEGLIQALVGIAGVSQSTEVDELVQPAYQPLFPCQPWFFMHKWNNNED
jgi:hypothetical protein